MTSSVVQGQWCDTKLRIGPFGKYYNTLCFSPQICISIVFVFSWNLCKFQEKLETMLMQNLGVQTESIMVFSGVAYISANNEAMLLKLGRDVAPYKIYQMVYILLLL